LFEVHLQHSITISGADPALLQVKILFTAFRIEIVSTYYYYCLSPVKRLHLNLAAAVLRIWTPSFIVLELKGNKLFITLLEFFLARYRFLCTSLHTGQIMFPHLELCFIKLLTQYDAMENAKWKAILNKLFT